MVTWENLPELPRDVQVSALGACLCTSFKWDTVTGKCTECGHDWHATRVHCGVMVKR